MIRNQITANSILNLEPRSSLGTSHTARSSWFCSKFGQEGLRILALVLILKHVCLKGSIPLLLEEYCSVISDSWQPHELHAAHQASLSITNSRSLLKLMSIQLVIPSNHLILRHPLHLPPSIFPSIRVFSNESVLIRWPKYWSFSFSISPFNEYSGLISFRIHWFDLLSVQGTL